MEQDPQNEVQPPEGGHRTPETRPRSPPAPQQALTVALAAVAVLAVAFVAVVAAVGSFFGGWKELPGLLFVFGDQGLGLFLGQLAVLHLVQVFALLREGVVGWREERGQGDPKGVKGWLGGC